MAASADDTQRTIFSGEYDYCNKTTIAMCLAFMLVGGFLIWFVLYVVILNNGMPPAWWGNKRVDLAGRVIFGIGGLPVGAVLAVHGFKLFNAIRFRKRAPIIITMDGIVWGSEYFEWESIAWIGREWTFLSRELGLVIEVPGMGLLAMPLIRSLTRRMFDELMQRIEDQIVPHYPHLAVGGTVGWINRFHIPPP